jgi:hypothetical protein
VSGNESNFIDLIVEGNPVQWNKLPASALAKDVDDAGEALAAVVPVCLQGSFDAIGVAVCQGTNDVVVFGDGELEIADDGAGIEAPVSLGLWLDRSVPLAQAGAGRADNKSMKVAVNLEDAALLAVIPFDVSELLIEGLQLLHDLHSVGFWESGGIASSQAFEPANDGIKFSCILFR